MKDDYYWDVHYTYIQAQMILEWKAIITENHQYTKYQLRYLLYIALRKKNRNHILFSTHVLLKQLYNLWQICKDRNAKPQKWEYVPSIEGYNMIMLNFLYTLVKHIFLQWWTCIVPYLQFWGDWYSLLFCLQSTCCESWWYDAVLEQWSFQVIFSSLGIVDIFSLCHIYSL